MSAPAWILVEYPGTESERVVDEYPTPEAALKEKCRLEDEGVPVDLMKRLPDGSLTTEI